jgi:hypothetical protein
MLSGNGYQRRTFPLLWVTELTPCLSYQLLTATAHNDCSDCSRTHFTSLHCTQLHSLTEMILSLRLILRPTASRPVCLGIKHQSGAYDHIFIAVRQLRVCWCGAFSLRRWRVCPLQLLLALANAVIFGSDSRGIHDHIFTVSDSRLPFSSPPTVLPLLCAGCCLATAVVSLFVSRSLPNNGSIRHYNPGLRKLKESCIVRKRRRYDLSQKLLLEVWRLADTFIKLLLTATK